MNLFQGLTIKTLNIRNRIVMPPMATVMDISTLQARRYYRERARGGVGLIIVEGTSIDRFSSVDSRKLFIRKVQPLSFSFFREVNYKVVRSSLPQQQKLVEK